jgi:hypothetical protein
VFKASLRLYSVTLSKLLFSGRTILSLTLFKIVMVLHRGQCTCSLSVHEYDPSCHQGPGVTSRCACFNKKVKSRKKYLGQQTEFCRELDKKKIVLETTPHPTWPTWATKETIFRAGRMAQVVRAPA